MKVTETLDIPAERKKKKRKKKKKRRVCHGVVCVVFVFETNRCVSGRPSMCLLRTGTQKKKFVVRRNIARDGFDSARLGLGPHPIGRLCSTIVEQTKPDETRILSFRLPRTVEGPDPDQRSPSFLPPLPRGLLQYEKGRRSLMPSKRR